jgi:hypothetical protein
MRKRPRREVYASSNESRPSLDPPTREPMRCSIEDILVSNT